MVRCLNPYPGESPGKSYVRAAVYQRVQQFWDEQGGDPGGHAVVLAGPEAMEVEVLRDFLRLPPSRVLFVDRDPEGLAVAKKKWPGVGIYHGELKDALRIVPKIGFLNLDFMGKYDKDVCLSARAARGKFTFGAVIAYTFFKGHEAIGQWGYRRQKSVVEDVLERPAVSHDEIRFAGTAACLVEDFALPSLKYRWNTSYKSKIGGYAGSPMGILMFQNSAY